MTAEEKAEFEEFRDDAVAFLRIARIYSRTSESIEVQGYEETITKAHDLAKEDKVEEAYQIIKELNKDDLTGVRDREFKRAVRDAEGSLFEFSTDSEKEELEEKLVPPEESED